MNNPIPRTISMLYCITLLRQLWLPIKQDKTENHDLYLSHHEEKRTVPVEQSVSFFMMSNEGSLYIPFLHMPDSLFRDLDKYRPGFRRENIRIIDQTDCTIFIQHKVITDGRNGVALIKVKL